MTLSTTYVSSSRGEMVIAEMAFPHVRNAVAKLRKEGAPETDPTLQALVERMNTLQAEYDAANPPPPTSQDDYGANSTLLASAQQTAPAADEPNPRAQIGGNNPPPFGVLLAERHANLTKRVDQAIADAGKLRVVETDAQHDVAVEVAKRITALLGEATAAKDKEKEEIKPLDQAINSFFLTGGIAGRLGPAKSALVLADGAYLQAKATAEAEALAAQAALARVEADKRIAEAAAAEQDGQNSIADVKMAGAVAHEEHAEKLESLATAPVQQLARTYSSAGTASLTTNLDWDVDREEVDLAALRPFLDDAAIDAAVRAFVKARGWKAADIVQVPGYPAPTKGIKGVKFRTVAKGRYR